MSKNFKELNLQKIKHVVDWEYYIALVAATKRDDTHFLTLPLSQKITRHKKWPVIREIIQLVYDIEENQLNSKRKQRLKLYINKGILPKEHLDYISVMSRFALGSKTPYLKIFKSKKFLNAMETRERLDEGNEFVKFYDKYVLGSKIADFCGARSVSLRKLRKIKKFDLEVLDIVGTGLSGHKVIDILTLENKNWIWDTVIIKNSIDTFPKLVHDKLFRILLKSFRKRLIITQMRMDISAGIALDYITKNCGIERASDEYIKSFITRNKLKLVKRCIVGTQDCWVIDK